MNYLQLVNSVLRRLREDEVDSVEQTSYSKLIGEFVNQTKREVEDAYNWNALTQSLTLYTTDGLFNYVLDGAGSRFRVIDVLNLTQKVKLKNQSREYMNTLYLANQPTSQKGSPWYYGWNGVNADGDYAVDLWPIPNKQYQLQFNLIIPQDQLEDNSTTLLVPSEPVILGAYYKAVRERGEDNGNAAAEVAIQYQGALSSAVAQENARFCEEAVWYPA